MTSYYSFAHDNMRCGKPVTLLTEWNTVCSLPKGHDSACVTYAIGGGGGGGPKRAALDAITPREAFEVAVALDQKIVLQLLDAVERLTSENGRLRAEQRDAFDAGFIAGGEWCVNYHETKTHAETASELAWEHYQAERMKAAASTEKEIEMTNKGHERTVTEIIEQMKDRGPGPITKVDREYAWGNSCEQANVYIERLREAIYEAYAELTNTHYHIRANVEKACTVLKPIAFEYDRDLDAADDLPLCPKCGNPFDPNRYHSCGPDDQK